MLGKEQKAVHEGPAAVRGMKSFSGIWKGLVRLVGISRSKPACRADVLKPIVERLTRVPDGFNINPKIARLLETRRNDVQNDRPIDWAFAESLAFGSLVQEGVPFAYRARIPSAARSVNAMRCSYDQKTGERSVPFNHIRPDETAFSVYDSLLSETAVLGFEFGYSLDDPDTLVLWEAQFGDFANGAQTIIDQFIVCSESKWQRSSGLVLLLAARL